MRLLALLGLIWIGWLIDWWHAHAALAAECERLGGFFVGKRVFKCMEITPVAEAKEVD